jgi:glycosyltransferase involved in cell wall biosynthesis
LESQGVRPLEVLVIDDASTDDSVVVVEEYSRRNPLVRLLRNERNLGVVATLNRGLREARGEFFYGGAADDLVEPAFIENVTRLIDRFPQAGIYFGAYRAIDAADREICIEKPRRWDEELFATPERFLNEYLEVEHCSHSLAPATVYRKAFLEDLGGFRSELGQWCDTFLIRSIGLKYGAGFTPQVLATMRRLDQGFSQSQTRNVRLMLDIIARAAWLMRSPALRDRFPEAHVTRWESEYRSYVIMRYLEEKHPYPTLGGNGSAPGRADSHTGHSPITYWPAFLWTRLLHSYHWRKTRNYSPDLSHYEETSST